MKNKKIIALIIMSVIFGIGGGVAGEIFFRSYLLKDALNVDRLSDINLQNDYRYDGSSLVIKNPKKVVVEQNDKVVETAKNTRNGIVGIFSRISTTTKDKAVKGEEEKINIDSYYNLNKEVGQGFIVTSDGWIISNFYPESILKEDADMKEILDNYVIITSGGEIYDVENVVVDEFSNYSFWRIEADDLPVWIFVSESDIHNGQLVTGVNWDGDVWVSTVQSKELDSDNVVKSSDGRKERLVLAQDPPKEFIGSFLFNLSGDLLALISEDGEVEPISSYVSCVNCLLETNTITRASLGVNYVNLSDFVKIYKDSFPEKGALIHEDEKGVAVRKGSAAQVAGLKAGDIIISVDKVEIGGDVELNDLMLKYSAKEEINLVYLRDGERNEVNIILDELIERK